MNITRLIGFSVPAAGAMAMLAFPVIPHPDRRTLAEDVFAKSVAVYASLKSYADTGAVETEYGPVGDPARERHTFRTYYRAPRDFFFEFVKQGNSDRLVVWSDANAFHSWWKSNGVENEYPKGQGNSAFTLGTYGTKGSIVQIPPLLFSKAGLVGTLAEFGDATEEGIEKVGAHPCHKLVGVAQDQYGTTGRVVNVRKTIVWVDVETFLIRKVSEDPKGTPPGRLNRTTTTFEPHANPTLDDAKFKFTAPSAQQ